MLGASRHVVVGVCELEFHLPMCRNLEQKRMQEAERHDGQLRRCEADYQ